MLRCSKELAMNRFFQNLFGTKLNQVRRTRQQRCQDWVKPQIEALEGRMLLASRITSLPVPAPIVQAQAPPATALRSKHTGTTLDGPAAGAILQIEAGSK